MEVYLVEVTITKPGDQEDMSDWQHVEHMYEEVQHVSLEDDVEAIAQKIREAIERNGGNTRVAVAPRLR